MRERIAKILLDTQAVFLRPEKPFIWASGIKSPIYCDNRLLLSFPDCRDTVENSIAEIVKKEYPDAEILMGTSTAGIAHAAIAADILDMPMGYVRGSAKGHGRGNRIEGKLKKGEKAVVVEDLISTAGSAIDAANAIREAGADVLGVVSIFTYGMRKGIERLKESNLKNVSLSDLDTLVDVAVREKYITEEDKYKLITFRDNPEDESWTKGVGK